MMSPSRSAHQVRQRPFQLSCPCKEQEIIPGQPSVLGPFEKPLHMRPQPLRNRSPLPCFIPGLAIPENHVATVTNIPSSNTSCLATRKKHTYETNAIATTALSSADFAASTKCRSITGLAYSWAPDCAPALANLQWSGCTTPAIHCKSSHARTADIMPLAALALPPCVVSRDRR